MGPNQWNGTEISDCQKPIPSTHNTRNVYSSVPLLLQTRMKVKIHLSVFGSAGPVCVKDLWRCTICGRADSENIKGLKSDFFLALHTL